MNKNLRLKPLVAALMLSSTTLLLADLETVNQYQPNTAQIKHALNSNQLILATGIFDPLQQTVDFHNSGINNQPSKQYGIVQFHAGKSDSQWLQKQGMQVIQSFSNNAYLVKWNRFDQNLLTPNNDIRWFGPYLSGYKVSPNLWQNNRASLTSYELSVEVFKGYPVDKIRPLIKKYAPEASFIASNYGSNESRVAIEIPIQHLNDSLNRLASTEAVQWINLYYTEQFFNNEAVAAVQATSSTTDNTPIFDQGIFGTGQIIGVADSGMDHNEDWFAHYDDGTGVNTEITAAANTVPPLAGPLSLENKVIGYWVMPGATAYDHIYPFPVSSVYHGTHVTASVAGDRLNCIGACNGETPTVSSPISSGYDNDDGMAPNAQILFQDIGSATGLTGVGSSPMWEQAYQAGVRVHNNSYGSTTAGEYTSSDQNLDRSLRQLDDMVIAVAAGNSGSAANTTGSPGNAKNALTVGALNHGNSSAVVGFSSRGLTDDGRLKPDIATTGTSIQSAAGDADDTSTIDTTPARSTKSGTSMATPITVGTTALLRQYFTDGFYPTGTANPADILTPSGQLMKALLLNGSNTDSGFNSTGSGWGRPWLENTLYFPGDSRSFKFWDVTHESGLSTGQSITFDVNVLAGEELRATLVWYDIPGPTGSAVALVNNLNLTVTSPDNTYLGNQFSGNVSVTGGTSDNINTVEQVRLTAAIAGEYNITVSAPSIPGDGTFGSDRQGYALVVSGALGTDSPVAITDPTNLTANDTGIAGVDLAWDAATGADYYEVYRADGTCASMVPGGLRFIAQVTSNSYNDASTNGGYDYAYQVRAFNADAVSMFTNCADFSSTQICQLPPTFNSESSTISSQINDTCEIAMTWESAVSNCPTDSSVSYKIYRSDTHNFTPGPGNLLATTAAGVNSYSDMMVSPDNNYFYRISAVNSANETNYSPELVSTPIGTSSSIEGTISDNFGASDSSLLMSAEAPWSISNDAASAGSLSYRSATEGAETYASNLCARAYSPTFSIPVSPSNNALLSYLASYEIEADWDGVVVEISTDDGTNWNDLPPIGGYPGDFSQTGNPAINGCGYPTTQGAFNGTTNGSFDAIDHDLSAYHGQTVQIRWSFSTDPGAEEAGMFLDEINYQNVNIPNVCMMSDNDLIFADGFEG